MPFDIGDIPQNETPIETYRGRRERAAALWRRVPQEVFDMTVWQCGSHACALGWLAAENFEGWWQGGMTPAGRCPRGPDCKAGYYAAASFFGLTLAEAEACFGHPDYSATFHHRGKLFASMRTVRPADVARTLLALPYFDAS